MQNNGTPPLRPQFPSENGGVTGDQKYTPQQSPQVRPHQMPQSQMRPPPGPIGSVPVSVPGVSAPRPMMPGLGPRPPLMGLPPGQPRPMMPAPLGQPRPMMPAPLGQPRPMMQIPPGHPQPTMTQPSNVMASPPIVRPPPPIIQGNPSQMSSAAIGPGMPPQMNPMGTATPSPSMAQSGAPGSSAPPRPAPRPSPFAAPPPATPGTHSQPLSPSSQMAPGYAPIHQAPLSVPRPPMPQMQSGPSFPGPPRPMMATPQGPPLRPPIPTPMSAPMGQMPQSLQSPPASGIVPPPHHMNPPVGSRPSMMTSPPPQMVPSGMPPMSSYPGMARPPMPQPGPMMHPGSMAQPGPVMQPGSMAQPSLMTPPFQRPHFQQPPHGMNPMAQQMQSTMPGQQMSAPAPAPKVNPALIPSVVAVLEADEARFRESGQPYLTCTSIIDQSPPLPTTRSAKIIDDGNSSPSLIRSTLNHVPVSEEVCENSKIPLALLVQPFADVSRLEGPVNVVDFGERGPIRCNRCRAYINPHAQFIKGGRFFVCNLCGLANDVPDDYYANLDMSGRRIDLDYRPELKYGTIDFVASKEYLNKPAGRPNLLFALDSTRGAVGSGSFFAALETIKSFANSPDALKLYGKVGVMTYGRIIQFYVLREHRSEPHLVVMSDINDPFVPMHEAVFFDPVACTNQFKTLLAQLSNSHHESTNLESCFGAAVSVAVDALKPQGGRAVFFQTALPNFGPGALKNRDTGVPPPADKANPLLFPQGDYYQKLAKTAAEQGVSLSLVSTPSAHMDLATIGLLPLTTSGTSFHYPKFNPQLHTAKMAADLVSWLALPFAFDVIVRVRCGSGLQPKKYYGACSTPNGTDFYFGSLNSDQSFGVWMEYDGKLSEKERIGFQCAALYTDAATGQRRIRVLNLALPVTSQMTTIFRMSELDSILSFYLKKNTSQILEAPAAAFPASFTAKCVNILSAYRRYCAANMSSGQLILPDSLKLFPVLTLATHKDLAFSSAPVSIDTKIHAIRLLSDLSIPLTVSHFYPELYPLHNVLEHEEILPAAMRLSREHLSRQGMYLMNNGHQLVLYLGDSVDPAVLSNVFGVSQLQAIHLNTHNLPVLNNPLSSKMRQIATALRSRCGRNLPLRIIRQSVDVAEDAEFGLWLVEDASSMAPSYVDFLCRVHSQIQQSLAQGPALSLADKTSILSFLQ